MEQVRGTHKAFIFAPKDFISCTPDDVITNIMDRLPIQYAVRTSILSREWRFKWTLLTQLIFDWKVAEYLLYGNGKKNFNGANLSRILFLLKGPITKFFLYFGGILDVEDVNHAVMSLSRKGIKDLTILNVKALKLVLPTHLYCCKQLKHLRLVCCCFPHPPTFQGFPNLLSLDLSFVTFDGNTFDKFSDQYPLLDTLKIMIFNTVGKVKLCEIAKLGNLKFLCLQLFVFENMTMITISSIFQLLCHVPKLQELHLDFWNFKFLAEACDEVDFSDDTMGTESDVPDPKLCSSDVEVNTMGQLRLEKATFTSFTGSENEVGLLKSILASSLLLKKIIIHPALTSVFGGNRVKKLFAEKLLKLHRASVAPEIYIR